MKKGMLPKIVAFLALFGIIIGIVGTALLFVLTPKGQVEQSKSTEMKLTPEQLKQLQDLTGTGSQISSGTFTGTGETK